MGLVLSIFGENAYKEFVLPTGADISTVLLCRKDIYSLAADIELRLDNIGGNWFYQESTAEHIYQDHQAYAHTSLQVGDYYLYKSPERRNLLAIIVQNSAERFASYTKYALNGSKILIGTDQGCALRYSFENSGLEYISRHHASIEEGRQGLSLTDLSKNGIFVNNRRVRGNVSLSFGDQIDLWGLNIVALGRILAVRETAGLIVDLGQMELQDLPMQELQETNAERKQYHRSPRRIARLVTGQIEIEDPPAPQNDQQISIIGSVGPALTMVIPMLAGSLLAMAGSRTGGTYMYTGLVTSVLSGLFGTIWAIRNARNAKKAREAYEARRVQLYSEYLHNKTNQIRRDYEANLRALQETYPAAATLATDGLKGRHLWERNTQHEDYLSYRLGLGDIPFQEDIHVPANRFTMVQDALRDGPDKIHDEFKTLHNAPVLVDLRKEHIVGLVGGPDLKGARSILRNLVTQIAVLNCYTDVKLAFLYQEDQGDDPDKWEYCRWLPHVWSEGHKVRYVAANREESSDVLYELAAMIRDRKEQAGHRSDKSETYRPWYILVFEDSAVLENEPIASYLLKPQENYGVTSLFLANSAEELPNACDCVLRWDADYSGMYHVSAQDQESGRIRMETLESSRLEQLARSLCNTEVNELEVGGEIPNSITFLDMYGVARPEDLHAGDLWRRGRTYENMRAQIGQKSGGQPCYLDVHEKYHGPHGLIAGTTGSGKSETLQTYILSLTMNYSPYDVGLFIIDYKGGGMANLFNGLPHMLGAISNLSGNQIQRAMVSIKSENLRRQRIFNENGVNNINLYTMLFKNGEATVPIPHLFIIIDEFAELKREQPEFMRELISVAQVGRSLGVHLILATQKPSGTVDDNIWSNSKFRLCLRVQDRQDSMDMLHKADAAYLTQAGRGYLQVGSDEVYEQFQSGWSGATYDAETAGTRQVLAKMLASNGKTAIVGSYQKRQQKERLRIAWIGQLATIYDRLTRGNEEQLSDEFLIGSMYQELQQMGVDYPESGLNTKALRNLIQLIDQAQQQGITGEDRARWIVMNGARSSIRLPERKEQTQLDAMVAYLAEEARCQGYEPLPPLWLPPLPGTLYLNELEGWGSATYCEGHWPEYGKKWELSALIGRVDDPRSQSQFTCSVNFSQGGHYALIGSASSGKSTFVQSLIYSLIHSYSPQYLNLYILDYSNRMTQPFLHDAHVGGILFEDDTARVGKLFYLLRTIIAERKQMFRGGNYEQYVMSNGVTVPAVVLIIDNMANFREKAGDAYDDDLMRIAREGAGYGIYMFVTGGGFGMSEIPNRLGNLIKSTLCLSLSDVYQYGDVLRVPKPDIYPEAGVSGRGLMAGDNGVLEYQTALALEAEDVYQRGEQIEAECRFMRQGWSGACAREIPFIPERPVWQDLMSRSEISDLMAGNRYLPIGYDYATAGVYSIDLRHTYCYTVQGRARTGKTNALKLCMHAAHEKGMQIAVIETDGNSLAKAAEQLHAPYYSTIEELRAFFIGELGPCFRDRNVLKKQLVANGAEEDEIFEQMSHQQSRLIVISDLASFIETATSKEAIACKLDKALENLIGKGFLFNIYFVAGYNPDDRVRMLGTSLYDAFIRDKCGMHLGGNVGAQQLFEFSGMPFKLQGEPEQPGIALMPPRNGISYKRVVLPLIKG